MLIILIEAFEMFYAYALSRLLQVAIEFGLSEIPNPIFIKSEVAPKDGKFDFKISDLEAMFPEGTVDSNVDMIYKEVLYMKKKSCLIFLYFVLCDYILTSFLDSLLVLFRCQNGENLHKPSRIDIIRQ